MLRKLPVTLFILLLAVAAEIKVATLNCFLLFDPRIDHRGKLDDEQRMSLAQYNEKLGNLSALIRLTSITPASREVTWAAAHATMFSRNHCKILSLHHNIPLQGAAPDQ